MKRLMFSLLALLATMAVLADDLPMTPVPVITVTEYDEYVEIIATGEGDVHMIINGLEVESPCEYSRSEEEQTIDICAYAQADGYGRSETAYMQYVVAPMPPTPIPIINVTDEMGCVVIEAIGEGEITMYINGEEVENPCIWYRTEVDLMIEIVATAKRYGYPRSEEAIVDYNVHALPQLPAPELIYELTDEAVILYTAGEGEITLYVNDQPVETPYTIPRGTEDQVIVAYAVATAEYCIPGVSAQATILIPALPEKADAPVLTVEIVGHYSPQAVVTITSEEEGAMIMFRYCVYDGYWSDWMDYDESIVFTEPGQYMVEAKARVPGKEMSDAAGIQFVLTDISPYPFYDFEVEGIYYKVLGNNKVGVMEHGEIQHGYQGDIVIPNQVTHDGQTYIVAEVLDDAFNGCSGVISLKLGNYLTKIGVRAFLDCTGLTEVTIGDYVLMIDNRAFSGCNGLKKLTIGHGVKTIGYDAFAGCDGLQTIICKPATPPVVANSGCFACYETATLKVYPAVLDAYQPKNYWNHFYIIVGEDTVNPVPSDVDGDGQVSINDVSSLIDILLGK